MKLRALQVAVAGCLLWLLLLPFGMGQPDPLSICAEALGQVLLDEGLADDQPDVTPPQDVFTRISDRDDFSASIEPSSYTIVLVDDLSDSTGVGRLAQSQLSDCNEPGFLLCRTRSPRAPPA